MLEDDTHSSQSTQDSVDQAKGTTKQPKGQGTKKAKRASRKQSSTTDNSGLTKLSRSLFRTPANPKGIIKQVKTRQKPNPSTKGPKSKKSSALPEKPSTKEIANRLKALKKPDQNLTLFTKNIIRALYELNEKNE